jgi:hypothetical protein
MRRSFPIDRLVIWHLSCPYCATNVNTT